MKLSKLIRAPLANLYSMRLLQLTLDYIDVTTTDKILDVGIGSGFGSYTISEYAREVVGIDISEKLVRFLDNQQKPRNVTFYVADATRQPDTEFLSEFDKAICIDVLEHVEYPGRLLEFIHKILRKGGCSVITFPIGRPHGRNRFDKDHVYELFCDSPLQAEIHFVKTKMFASLISGLYAKIRQILKPSREADRFDNLGAFDMMTNPKKIHKLYKLGSVILFKMIRNAYREDESGRRALIVAEKV